MTILVLEIGVSLKQFMKFFSDLINIISLKYSIKRGIEVIQQSHNLQFEKKDIRRINSREMITYKVYLISEKNKY